MWNIDNKTSGEENNPTLYFPLQIQVACETL
jgi:hypothetical protein